MKMLHNVSGCFQKMFTELALHHSCLSWFVMFFLMPLCMIALVFLGAMLVGLPIYWLLG